VGHATGAAIPSILLVPTGRKGKYRVEGQIAIKVGADVLDVLKLVAEGRAIRRSLVPLASRPGWSGPVGKQQPRVPGKPHPKCSADGIGFARRRS